MAGLFDTRSSGRGLAPFGIRHAGDSAKGRGFLGLLASRGHGGDYSSELSYTFGEPGNEYDAPMLVPTLTLAEVQHLLSGGKPTEEMFNKAVAHAEDRIKRGLSPFIGYGEMRSVPGALDIEGND